MAIRDVTISNLIDLICGDAIIDHAIEDGRLQRIHPEAKHCTTEGLHAARSCPAARLRQRHSSFCVIACAPKRNACGPLASIARHPRSALMFWKKWVRSSCEMFDDPIPVFLQNHSAKQMIIQALSETLFAKTVWHARLRQNLEPAIHHRNLQGIDFPHSNRKSISGKMSRSQFIAVAKSPKHEQPIMRQFCRWFFSWKVDRDGLARDCVTIFSSRSTNRIGVDFEVICNDAEHFIMRHIFFLNSKIEMFAFA